MCDTNDNNNNLDVSSNNELKNRGTIESNWKNVASMDTEATIMTFKPKIRWPDLGAQLFLHIGAIYGLIFQFYEIRVFTLIWCE